MLSGSSTRCIFLCIKLTVWASLKYAFSQRIIFLCTLYLCIFDIVLIAYVSAYIMYKLVCLLADLQISVLSACCKFVSKTK